MSIESGIPFQTVPDTFSHDLITFEYDSNNSGIHFQNVVLNSEAINKLGNDLVEEYIDIDGDGVDDDTLLISKNDANSYYMTLTNNDSSGFRDILTISNGGTMYLKSEKFETDGDDNMFNTNDDTRRTINVSEIIGGRFDGSYQLHYWPTATRSQLEEIDSPLVTYHKDSEINKPDEYSFYTIVKGSEVSFVNQVKENLAGTTLEWVQGEVFDKLPEGFAKLDTKAMSWQQWGDGVLNGDYELGTIVNKLKGEPIPIENESQFKELNYEQFAALLEGDFPGISIK